MKKISLNILDKGLIKEIYEEIIISINTKDEFPNYMALNMVIINILSRIYSF